MSVTNKYLRVALITIILIIIYGFGVGLRWKIVDGLDRYFAGLIFVRESAFYFYFAKELDKKGSIPKIDYKAQYPEGFDVERDHNFAKGKLTVFFHKIPVLRNIQFEKFARYFDSIFFCLGAIPLFFISRLFSKNDWLSLALSAVYLIGMPVLPRSTGAGFDMETFSIPLLITHLFLFLYGILKGGFWFSILSGIVLGIAIAGWDFCQFYMLIFAGFVFLAILVLSDWQSILKHFTATLPGVIIAGIVCGYLRSHFFLVSFGMLLSYPLGMTGIILFKKQIKRLYIAPAVMLIFSILVIFSDVFFDYSETYLHVGQKFISKIRHLNTKPDDPGELTFTERIEWTPPFNSATQKFGGRYPFVRMLRYAVPALMPLALIIAGFFKGRRRTEEIMILWNIGVFFVLYLMFVRMEVLLVIFLIIAVGIAWKYFCRLRGFLRTAMMIIWAAYIGGLLLFEICLTIPPSKNLAKFTPESSDKIIAQKGLIDVVKDSTKPDSIILADFNVSPVILAYADRGIILHPKFESVQMRMRVKEYYEALFSRNEFDLNRFCNKYKADFFIFTYYVWMPEKGEEGWLYSPKYIAGVVDTGYLPYGFRYLVSDDSRVAYFKPIPEKTVSAPDPEKGEYVVRYKIYGVVSDTDMEKAREHLARGEMKLAIEEYEDAIEELKKGIELFPGLPSHAYTKLGTAYMSIGDYDMGDKYFKMGSTFHKEGR